MCSKSLQIQDNSQHINLVFLFLFLPPYRPISPSYRNQSNDLFCFYMRRFAQFGAICITFKKTPMEECYISKVFSMGVFHVFYMMGTLVVERLTHFKPMFHFLPPERFSDVSGGTERDHWLEIEAL